MTQPLSLCITEGCKNPAINPDIGIDICEDCNAAYKRPRQTGFWGCAMGLAGNRILDCDGDQEHDDERATAVILADYSTGIDRHHRNCLPDFKGHQGGQN